MDRDDLDDIDSDSLESIDTPRHESDQRSTVEVVSTKALSTRDRIKEKARSLLEKINQTAVRLR